MSLESAAVITSKTEFRNWLEVLGNVRGNRPLWPALLGAALDAEFQRQVRSDACYARDVFKNRDNHSLEDGEREERLVARLYRAAHAIDGCVTVNGERIWLLGYQWPTQGGAREKGRRADLVGITPEGGLVVFEAKVATGAAPLIAIIEGLDYLACLLRPRNFDKILNGFDQWKPSKRVPVGFEESLPDRHCRPTLIVTAPLTYFTGRQARGIRGRDWPQLADIGDTIMPSVRLMLAATDFKSIELQLMKSVSGDGT
jgi:hypothetical protein